MKRIIKGLTYGFATFGAYVAVCIGMEYYELSRMTEEERKLWLEQQKKQQIR